MSRMRPSPVGAPKVGGPARIIYVCKLPSMSPPLLLQKTLRQWGHAPFPYATRSWRLFYVHRPIPHRLSWRGAVMAARVCVPEVLPDRRSHRDNSATSLPITSENGPVEVMQARSMRGAPVVGQDLRGWALGTPAPHGQPSRPPKRCTPARQCALAKRMRGHRGAPFVHPAGSPLPMRPTSAFSCGASFRACPSCSCASASWARRARTMAASPHCCSLRGAAAKSLCSLGLAGVPMMPRPPEHGTDVLLQGRLAPPSLGRSPSPAGRPQVLAALRLVLGPPARCTAPLPREQWPQARSPA